MGLLALGGQNGKSEEGRQWLGVRRAGRKEASTTSKREDVKPYPKELREQVVKVA